MQWNIYRNVCALKETNIDWVRDKQANVCQFSFKASEKLRVLEQFLTFKTNSAKSIYQVAFATFFQEKKD